MKARIAPINNGAEKQKMVPPKSEEREAFGSAGLGEVLRLTPLINPNKRAIRLVISRNAGNR